jgi:hypothetical protein
VTTELVRTDTQATAVQAPASIELTAIATDVLIARKKAVDKVVQELFVIDVHYGPVPGVPDSMMLEKAGAELLASCFGLALSYQIEESRLPGGGVRFVSTCNVASQATGTVLGSGMGESSTEETKFAWRKTSDTEYNDTPDDRRRIKTYPGKGGKGTWQQKQVRELTEDKANTCLKMANKRAASDAIQAVLGVRGLILQGLQPGGHAGAPAAPQTITEDMAREVLFLAAKKGVKDPDKALVSGVRRDRGSQAKSLTDVSESDYGYLLFKLLQLPDAVEAETGEVVEEDDQPIGFGMTAEESRQSRGANTKSVTEEGRIT